MTFSERQGRRKAATREYAVFMATAIVLFVLGALVLAGIHLGQLVLPRADGAAPVGAAIIIEIIGVLRFGRNRRNAGLRRR